MKKPVKPSNFLLVSSEYLADNSTEPGNVAVILMTIVSWARCLLSSDTHVSNLETTAFEFVDVSL